MKRTARVMMAFLCSGAILLLPGRSPATLTGTFDSSAEGWTAYASRPGGVGDFQFHATGGNPGGHIGAEDTGTGAWLFLAPGAWSGDWTRYIGGTVSFDLLVQTADQRPTYTPNLPIVVLDLGTAGDGIYLSWRSDINPPPNQWTRYWVDIAPENFQVVNSSSSFQEVIKNVTDFFIQGDYLEGTGERTRLDNVSVTPSVPEPGALAFLATGLAGMLGCFRKKNAFPDSLPIGASALSPVRGFTHDGRGNPGPTASQAVILPCAPNGGSPPPRPSAGGARSPSAIHTGDNQFQHNMLK